MPPRGPDRARKGGGAQAGEIGPSVPQKRQIIGFSRQSKQHLSSASSLDTGRNKLSAEPEKSNVSATYSAMLQKQQQEQQERSMMQLSESFIASPRQAEPDVGSSSRSKNEEAAESFLALLQSPDVKRKSLGSPGRAQGGERKDKEKNALFSLLSLPAYHSAILGVRLSVTIWMCVQAYSSRVSVLA